MLLVPASEQDMGSTLTVDDCPVTLDTDPYAPPLPVWASLSGAEIGAERVENRVSGAERSGERAWQNTVMQMRERSAEREVAEWER